MPPTPSTSTPGSPTPALRAADRDREEVLASLREHGAAGRLDVDELAERTHAALGARTLDELAPLTGDLPDLRRDRARSAERAAAQQELKSHVAIYIAVNAALIVIWALSGLGYFWPIWSIGGWGLGVFSHWSDVRRGRPHHGARGCGGHRRRRAPEHV